MLFPVFTLDLHQHTALALPPRCDRWSETLDNLKQNAICSLYSVELQSNKWQGVDPGAVVFFLILVL